MIDWLRRMFRRPEPMVEQRIHAEQVRSDAVLAKAKRVLTPEDRLDLLRHSSSRANRRLGHDPR